VAFIEFDLYSNAICMGERIKGGLFRPCCKTIRYSQISGALRKKFGNDKIHAAGYLIDGNGYNRTDYLIYSPRERSTGVSRIPLEVEILTNMHGKVHVFENDFTAELPRAFNIVMGALISKGLGQCELRRTRVVSADHPRLGLLRTRIPMDKQDTFNIRRIIRPVYGYLFEPTSTTSGKYVLSLFEGSEVVAPEFLVSSK
jgi:hypothetical protein